MEKLKYIIHQDIDFKKWDATILSSDFPFVFAQSFYLNATCPNSGTLNWYNVSTGGSSLSTASPFSPTNIISNTSYYATCTENACEGARTLVGSVVIACTPA